MKRKILTTFLALVLSAGVAFAGARTYTVLDGVTATGASSGFNAVDWNNKTFYIIAADVSTGGTVNIEVSGDESSWVSIQDVAVTANGVTEVAISNILNKYIRANVSARTDGTYTVIMVLDQ